MQDFLKSQEVLYCSISVCFLAAHFTRSLEAVTQVNCVGTVCEDLRSILL